MQIIDFVIPHMISLPLQEQEVDQSVEEKQPFIIQQGSADKVDFIHSICNGQGKSAVPFYCYYVRLLNGHD